jgi:hypothetical protein
MIWLECCKFPPSSGWDGLVEQRGAVLLSARGGGIRTPGLFGRLSWRHVFSATDVSKCLLLDDFHSSGRTSGNQRIPLAKLASGKKYIVEGQRLEVNPSVDRYKREMANLSAAL